MTIEEALLKLEHYANRENYKGHDPYDALKSPLFKLAFFRSNKIIRFGAQQFVKRFPINLRPLLFVPKGLNPVTVGLFIQGYAYLSAISNEKKDLYKSSIIDLTEELKALIPDGYSGVCWGYDFDWEARHASIPAYQPTVVATGIITNGLFEAWRITRSEILADLIISAADFVINDLNRTYDGDTFCFSYSPFDQQQVFNASMKGVRLLSQAYSLSGNSEFKQKAEQAVHFVINHQKEDGSWDYSLADKGTWIDNYHTGYILDCLYAYIELCEENDLKGEMSRGFHFYRQHFFGKDGRPAFYSNEIYPADCTAASQSILTLARFEEIELAKRVANWTIKHMQADDGSFYFRKYKFYTIKTPFMRWSNAWMFAAFAYLLKVVKDQ